MLACALCLIDSTSRDPRGQAGTDAKPETA